MKQNTKGFTLIELLAVIVILAIIALIATPIVLNMINSARKSAAKSSALGYVDAIEYNNGFAMLATDAGVEGYTQVPDGTYADANISTVTNTIKDHLKGKAPDAVTGSTITITNGKVTAAKLIYGSYTCTMSGNDFNC